MKELNETKSIDKEIVIENKYLITEELYKKWSKDNKRSVSFKIFWIIFAIIYLVISILSIISKDIYYAMICGLIAFYAIFAGVFARHLRTLKTYKMLAKIYKKSNWERRIIFFNDYFEIIDENINIVRFQYSDIISIEKNNECMKIKLNYGYIRIYRNAFVKSNFEECEKFLNEKIK